MLKDKYIDKLEEDLVLATSRSEKLKIAVELEDAAEDCRVTIEDLIDLEKQGHNFIGAIEEAEKTSERIKQALTYLD